MAEPRGPAGWRLDELTAHRVGMVSDECLALADDQHERLVEEDGTVSHVGVCWQVADCRTLQAVAIKNLLADTSRHRSS